jgi:hypothetical protein
MAQFDSIRFTPGRPLTKELGSERLNAIITEIKRNKPKGERGITVRQDGTGTYIGLAAARGRGGSSTPTTPQPLDIIATPDPDADPEDENPSYILRVQPGTVARMLPTNWEDEFNASSETLYYGIVSLATDGRFITGATIEIEEEAPDDQEPQKYGIENPVKLVFGLFKDGKQYNLSGGQDIAVSAVAILATSADPAAQPGESPYDIWFKLQ